MSLLRPGVIKQHKPNQTYCNVGEHVLGDSACESSLCAHYLDVTMPDKGPASPSLIVFWVGWLFCMFTLYNLLPTVPVLIHTGKTTNKFIRLKSNICTDNSWTVRSMWSFSCKYSKTVLFFYQVSSFPACSQQTDLFLPSEAWDKNLFA